MIGGKFWKNNKKPLSIVVLFLLPLVPLYYDDIPLPKLHLYERFSHYISAPISTFVSYSRHGSSHLWGRYISLIETEKENKILKQSLEETQQKLLLYQEHEKENERFTKLLGLRSTTEHPLKNARIIGYDPQRKSLNFFINVGSQHDIKENMPVISPDGIVGTVEKVYPKSSLVTSILNPNHSVDGRIIRTRSRMIVEGLGERLLAQLKYLDRAEDIRVGDQVLTSGLDPVFPKGLVIGNIVNVKRPKTGVTQKANLRAAVDLGKLEEVSVILKEDPLLEAEGSP